MATEIEAWSKYGPKLASTTPITPEIVIRRLIRNTNQTKGSVLAVLAELDEIILEGLLEGRIVQLPNGTHYRPVGNKDGKINVKVRVNPEIDKELQTNFYGKWLNAENIGISQEGIIALWNADTPEDLIE